MCMNVLHLNMQILLVHLTSTPTSICSNWSSLGRQRDWRSTILRRHRQELPAKPSCSVAAGRGAKTHIPNPKKKLGDGTPRSTESFFRSKKVHGTLHIYHLSCDMYILHTSNHENSFNFEFAQHGISKKENTPTVWPFQQSSVDS